MNKLISMLAAVLALGAPVASQAAQLITITSWSDSAFTDANGPINSSDGYVATLWWGDSAGSTLSYVDSDLLFDGYWDQLADKVMGEKGAPLYTEVRIFQYTPGQAVTQATLDGLTGADWAEYWDLIQGTQVSQGVIGGTANFNSLGGGTTVSDDYDYVTHPSVMTGVPGTTAGGGNVPEPSTYAALAGLAVLAFVAARRVRK